MGGPKTALSRLPSPPIRGEESRSSSSCGLTEDPEDAGEGQRTDPHPDLVGEDFAFGRKVVGVSVAASSPTTWCTSESPGPSSKGFPSDRSAAGWDSHLDLLFEHLWTAKARRTSFGGGWCVQPIRPLPDHLVWPRAGIGGGGDGALGQGFGGEGRGRGMDGMGGGWNGWQEGQGRNWQGPPQYWGGDYQGGPPQFFQSGGSKMSQGQFSGQMQGPYQGMRPPVQFQEQIR